MSDQIKQCLAYVSSYRQRQEFISNPPLPDVPVIEPLEVDGVMTNKTVMKPCSNRSYWDGSHYCAETMSLRAKLNLGLDLPKVQLPGLENDPSVLYSRSIYFEKVIQDKHSWSPDIENIQPLNHHWQYDY